MITLDRLRRNHLQHRECLHRSDSHNRSLAADSAFERSNACSSLDPPADSAPAGQLNAGAA